MKIHRTNFTTFTQTQFRFSDLPECQTTGNQWEMPNIGAPVIVRVRVWIAVRVRIQVRVRVYAEVEVKVTVKVRVRTRVRDRSGHAPGLRTLSVLCNSRASIVASCNTGPRNEPLTIPRISVVRTSTEGSLDDLCYMKILLALHYTDIITYSLRH